MNKMINEQKAQQIRGCNRANCLECGGSLSVANGCVEFERIMAMADFKDTQPISELGGWHTEPPTEDCTVLLLIQDSYICIWEVATWNNDKRYFQSLHSNFITFWTKWKLI